MCRSKEINEESPEAYSDIFVCVRLCHGKSYIGRELFTGQYVSTSSTCIDFCHIGIGFVPLGVCWDALGRLLSSPSEALIFSPHHSVQFKNLIVVVQTQWNCNSASHGQFVLRTEIFIKKEYRWPFILNLNQLNKLLSDKKNAQTWERLFSHFSHSVISHTNQKTDPVTHNLVYCTTLLLQPASLQHHGQTLNTELQLPALITV